MALVDYRGYRVIATCVLPIGTDTLIYGSSDAGRTAYTKNHHFNSLMSLVGEALNLRPHYVGLVKKKILVCGGDVEGHKARDGKFYLLDFSRVLPPTRPLSSVLHPNSHLYMLFRNEFLQKYPKTLCSDGYSAFITPDPNRAEYDSDLNEATHHLEAKCIPSFAKELMHVLLEAKESGVLASVNITEHMHRRGINLRYIGLLCRALLHINNPQVLICMYIVFTEAVARTLKNLLYHKLRELSRLIRVPVEIPYRQLAADHCNLIFMGDSPSVEFWEESVIPYLVNHYNFPSDLLDQTSLSIAIERQIQNSFDNALSCDGRAAMKFAFGLHPTLEVENRNGMIALLRRVEELTSMSFSHRVEEKIASESFFFTFFLFYFYLFIFFFIFFYF
jgi:hypothetical protein